MTKEAAQALQAAYEAQRRRVRDGWFTEYEEDWCCRREIDPRNGRPRYEEPELR